MFRKLVQTMLLLAFIGGGVLYASFYVAATRWRSPAPAVIDIPRGSSVRAISDQLAKEGAIRTPRFFELYVRLMGYSSQLKAGTYDLQAGMNMLDIADKIVSGDVREYEFIIVEGWTIKDIAKALGGQPYLESEGMPAEFERLARDGEIVKELGFEGAVSLEGYLFPDTYRVDYPLKAKDLIVRLTKKFYEVWGSMVKNDSGHDGRTRNAVVTLASIVEKETGVAAERPLIASVMMNRLDRGTALQSDPTIIYGLLSFDGNIRKNDISNPHPYNTYVHRGLPPGPICNPGKASLMAALHPEVTEYLYFVSMNDGSHYFSKDLAEHLKAVRRYQIAGEGKQQ